MTIKMKFLGLLLAFAACKPAVVEDPYKNAPPVDPKITRAAAFQLFHEQFKHAANVEDLRLMLSLCRFPLESGQDAMTFADSFDSYFTDAAIHRIYGSEHIDWDFLDNDERSYIVNERNGVIFFAKKIDDQYKIVSIKVE